MALSRSSTTLLVYLSPPEYQQGALFPQLCLCLRRARAFGTQGWKTEETGRETRLSAAGQACHPGHPGCLRLKSSPRSHSFAGVFRRLCLPPLFCSQSSLLLLFFSRAFWGLEFGNRQRQMSDMPPPLPATRAPRASQSRKSCMPRGPKAAPNLKGFARMSELAILLSHSLSLSSPLFSSNVSLISLAGPLSTTHTTQTEICREEDREKR